MQVPFVDVQPSFRASFDSVETQKLNHLRWRCRLLRFRDGDGEKQTNRSNSGAFERHAESPEVETAKVHMDQWNDPCASPARPPASRRH